LLNINEINYDFRVQIEPFLVVSFSSVPLSESSFNNLSLSFLGVPDNSENSFAVSELYFSKRLSQFLEYSDFLVSEFTLRTAVS
jgi:hypothetical protein